MYRVDYSRANEFGLTPITPEEAINKMRAEEEAAAAKKDGQGQGQPKQIEGEKKEGETEGQQVVLREKRERRNE